MAYLFDTDAISETLRPRPALGYLAWLVATGDSAVAREGLRTQALVAGSGLMTAVPLVWFVNGARRPPPTESRGRRLGVVSR